MKVALFTCYSPDVGGGGAHLRALVPHLAGCRVLWFHLAASPSSWPDSTCLGPALIGGGLVADLVLSPLLWLGVKDARLEAMVARILREKADLHWIVAMNEGILIGNRLRQGAPHTPLHVSVQDDQEFGMFGRSKRYRWMARLTRKPAHRLLTGANSIDVISEGMRRFYAAKWAISSTVVHRYIPALPVCASPASARKVLTVGHIGSVYSARTLHAFVHALRKFAATRHQSLRLIFIGRTRHLEIVYAAAPEAELVCEPDLPELSAVQRLMECDFVYAMYPFDRASDVFSRTSLPTKMTTYLQAQRPILAHAPESSTLAALLREHPVGVVAPGESPGILVGALETVTGLSIPCETWERMRAQVYGYGNVARLRSCFDRAARASRPSTLA